ncbi:MAG: IPT/TIG domain-containing protein [Chloroflexi bacterium]|nr:IPT/TIG domain-containing protein [Chloroflexota bacterium]
MKYTKKIYRALVIGVILSLLVIVIPASPALAAREIDLDTDEGDIGDYIDIDGNDWPPSDPGADPPYYKYVDIYFTSDEAVKGDDIDDEVEIYELVEEKLQVDTSGDFGARFRAPDELTDGSPDEDVRGGTYYVCVTYWDDEDIKAVADYTVIAGKITKFSPDEGPVGTEVEINGEDFGDGEDITIKYDGDTLDIESGDDAADSSGDVDCTIIIPESIAGDHTLTISDESLSEVEEVFTVEPEITISPTQAPPGDTATVTGTGYGKKVDVDITLDGDVVATKTTDSDGGFTVSFEVPEVDEGDYEVTAEDEDNNDATVDFTVEKGIEVSASVTTGHVGSEITISGFGFKANSPITITYTSEPVVFTTTSDADGVFTYTFDVPQSGAGAHTITATDGTDTLQVSFTMESQAPSIPAPLLPEMDTKAEALAEFDWESVTDDSGVTYTLQIATSEDFTASSIVLEKTGLASSEYTLTKEEALESTAKEDPYYWRLKAVDGASNESGWTGVGSFYVSSSLFDLSGKSWLIHLWWGLGALGAGFAGYFVGKRRSYYY